MSPLPRLSRLIVGGTVSRVVREDVSSFAIMTHSSEYNELVARCNGEMAVRSYHCKGILHFVYVGIVSLKFNEVM